MAQIQGQINDSVGQPIDGTLIVSLPYPTLFGSEVNTQVIEEYVITAGVIDIDIPASEVNGAVYTFRFLDSNDAELFKFEAGVPDLVTVIDFANLFPTGVTTTNLDTSTFAIARRITGDPILSEQFKQPSVYTKELSGVTNSLVVRVPKPFTGALKLLTLTVLDVENSEDWTFETGFVNNDGTDVDVTPDSTITENTGFLFVQQIYEGQTSSSTVKGLFLKVTPGASAGPLTAVVSISYLEV